VCSDWWLFRLRVCHLCSNPKPTGCLPSLITIDGDGAGDPDVCEMLFAQLGNASKIPARDIIKIADMDTADSSSQGTGSRLLAAKL